jgi:hypothetical protein
VRATSRRLSYDGRDGPPLELRGLFEQFLREVS